MIANNTNANLLAQAISGPAFAPLRLMAETAFRSDEASKLEDAKWRSMMAFYTRRR